MLLATQDGQNEYARDKKPGLLVPHFAGCYATPRRSRPKPHQPDLFAPRSASMLQFCQPRALHFTSTAPRAASASLGTASAPFFRVLPPSSELCPRAGILESRPWISSDQESPFCRFTEGSIGPRASLRREPGRSSRDILWTRGAGPSRILASAPGARAWALRFTPSLRKQAALDGIFVAIIFFQFEHTDGLYGSQYRRCLLYTSPSPRDQRGSRMPSSA